MLTMGDSDDENFVTFGEALEPLDEDNLPRKKPVTVEDQFALDAQGRRRFHGAFTGGFSAGYFNSVGTPDGWRPHQFKSSRSQKAENVCQRPEDFMDDEDTGEFGIAPTGIRATSDFVNNSGKGNKRVRPQTNNNGPIPGMPVLKELLKTVTDTVGVKLLKKMGWKPGQGVGPRLTKNEKKKVRQKNIQKKVYGCSLPNAEMKAIESHSSSSDEDDELNDGILFAPDDFEPFRCNPKDNYFGIGYSGLDKLSVLSGHINLIDTPAFQMQDKNKKLSIRGQAFGVGAFEADDDDIYERDDMSRYDFTLGPETTKKKSLSNKSMCKSSQNTCVEGFILAENRLERKKVFTPPNLSENFKPVHVIRKSRFSAETDEVKILNNSNWKSHGRFNINAHDREKILGDFDLSASNNDRNELEQKCELVADNESVTNPLACNSQTSEFAVQHKQKDECPPPTIQKSLPVPSWMEKLTTTTFVSGGIEATDKRPFIHDMDKQKRYEKFLQFSKNNEKEKLEDIQPLSMKKWDRDCELEEFERVAKSFNQSDTSKCKQSETECNTTVHNLVSDDFVIKAAKMKMFGKFTRTIDIWRPASVVCKRFNISEPKSGCAQPNIEKTKRYRLFESLDFCGGDVTSDIKFQKAGGKLLTDEDSNKIDKSSASNSSNVENENKLSNISSIDIIPTETTEKSQNLGDICSKTLNKNIESTFNAELTSTQCDFKEETKIIETKVNSPFDIQVNANSEAKADLFKAIFLSSSESSDSENEPLEDINSDVVKSLLIGQSANELNTQRNTSPARGIFAQLNLDDMITSNENTQIKHKKSTESANSDELSLRHSTESCHEKNPSDKNTIMNKNFDTSDSIKSGTDISSDIYGPALPLKHININNQSSCSKDNSEKPIFKSVVVKKLSTIEKTTKWVEKLKTKKSKKEKKKHKQKEKRKDRKHKHKSKKKKSD